MSPSCAYTLTADPGSLVGEAGLARWWSQCWTEAFNSFSGMAATANDRDEQGLDSASLVDFNDIAAARNGDAEAFRRLVQRYQPVIAVQMRRFSREPQLCEELVHDVFVAAYFSLTSYRGDAPWLHWLRKIAVRIGYQHWTARKATREVVHLSPEDWQVLQGTSSEPIAAQEAADFVAHLLAQLPPADRLILTLLYLDGCSMVEAASQAGWTVMGAKLRAFRARKKLQALIQRGDR